MVRPPVTGAPSSHAWVHSWGLACTAGPSTRAAAALKENLSFSSGLHDKYAALGSINRTGWGGVGLGNHIAVQSEVHTRGVFFLATSPVQQRARDREKQASLPWRSRRPRRSSPPPLLSSSGLSHPLFAFLLPE